MSEPATPIVPMNDDSEGNEYEKIAKGMETETLVVVSKVKKFIKEQAGLNTSQCYVDALTTKVVAMSLEGIAKAKQAGRKTVMGRDILPE